jgi:hypothetical protein
LIEHRTATNLKRQATKRKIPIMKILVPVKRVVDYNVKIRVKLNTVHFAIWMAAVKSMRAVGCGVRGRSG